MPAWHALCRSWAAASGVALACQRPSKLLFRSLASRRICHGRVLLRPDEARHFPPRDGIGWVGPVGGPCLGCCQAAPFVPTPQLLGAGPHPEAGRRNRRNRPAAAQQRRRVRPDHQQPGQGRQAPPDGRELCVRGRGVAVALSAVDRSSRSRTAATRAGLPWRAALGSAGQHGAGFVRTPTCILSCTAVLRLRPPIHPPTSPTPSGGRPAPADLFSHAPLVLHSPVVMLAPQKSTFSLFPLPSPRWHRFLEPRLTWWHCCSQALPSSTSAVVCRPSGRILCRSPPFHSCRGCTCPNCSPVLSLRQNFHPASGCYTHPEHPAVPAWS